MIVGINVSLAHNIAFLHYTQFPLENKYNVFAIIVAVFASLQLVIFYSTLISQIHKIDLVLPNTKRARKLSYKLVIHS